MTDTPITPAEHFARACGALEDALTRAYVGQSPELTDAERLRLRDPIRTHLACALAWLATIPDPEGSTRAVPCSARDLEEQLQSSDGLSAPEIQRVLGWTPACVRAALSELREDGYLIVRHRARGLHHPRYRIVRQTNN